MLQLLLSSMKIASEPSQEVSAGLTSESLIRNAALPGAIVFDLGKVIIPFDFARGYRALESFGPHAAADIPARIRLTGLGPLLETGQITPQAFVEALCREIGLRITYSEFCEVWNSIFLPQTLLPDEMIAALAGRFRLVLLSNTNRIHFEGIRAKYPILRHFHSFILSYEVGIMKPDVEIYRRAAEAAGLPPAECLFVDDLAENIAGARNAGMRAIHFLSREQLERDLETLGIFWR